LCLDKAPTGIEVESAGTAKRRLRLPVQSFVQGLYIAASENVGRIGEQYVGSFPDRQCAVEVRDTPRAGRAGVDRDAERVPPGSGLVQRPVIGGVIDQMDIEVGE